MISTKPLPFKTSPKMDRNEEENIIKYTKVLKETKVKMLSVKVES